MTGELLPTIRFHILKWEMHNQMCVPAHLGTKVSQKPKTRSSGAMLVIYLKLRCEIGELLTAISIGKGIIKVYGKFEHEPVTTSKAPNWFLL